MSEDVEPFPPGRGKTWEAGSAEYVARLEYINARIDRYFAKFQDSIDYDFSRVTPNIEKLQSAIMEQSSLYAKGETDISAVQITANALREAFKRKELLTSKPNPEQRKRDNRRYFAEKRREDQFTNGYPTRVHYEMAQELKRYVVKDGGKPISGRMCFQYFTNRAWDANGEPIDFEDARRLIRQTIEEKFADRIYCYAVVTYTKPRGSSSRNTGGKEVAYSGDEATASNLPPVPSAKGRTLDDLKREESERKQKDRLDKLQRRGKRS